MLTSPDNGFAQYFVSKQLAKKIAGNISFENGFRRPVDNPKNDIEEVFPVVNQQSDTVYYIINYHSGGFVILSADQRTVPILARSPKNSFPTNAPYYPSGLVDWLEASSEYIDGLRYVNPKQDSEIKDEWDNLVYGRYPGGPIFDQDGNSNEGGCEDSYTMVNPLMTLEWDQLCGFNDDMPFLSCGPCDNAYVGCVPIAIAQVMRYHEHPSSYNWSNMPVDYSTTTTSAFIRDVFDKIPASEKSYDCDGTGVDHDYNVANFMKVDFNYSTANNANYIGNSTIVENDIANGRPVILSGGENIGWWIFNSYGNGHMWVTDGYIRGELCFGQRNDVHLISSHALGLE